MLGRIISLTILLSALVVACGSESAVTPSQSDVASVNRDTATADVDADNGLDADTSSPDDRVSDGSDAPSIDAGSALDTMDADDSVADATNPQIDAYDAPLPLLPDASGDGCPPTLDFDYFRTPCQSDREICVYRRAQWIYVYHCGCNDIATWSGYGGGSDLPDCPDAPPTEGASCPRPMGCGYYPNILFNCVPIDGGFIWQSRAGAPSGSGVDCLTRPNPALVDPGGLDRSLMVGSLTPEQRQQFCTWYVSTLRHGAAPPARLMPISPGLISGYLCSSCGFSDYRITAVIPAVEDCVANLRLLSACHGTLGALGDCAATLANTCFRDGDGCTAWVHATGCDLALLSITRSCDLHVE